MIPEYSERALILAPGGRDSRLAADMLTEAGINSVACTDLDCVIAELTAGAGFGLITEEAVADADLRPLNDWLEAQPEWSDLPFILLTRRGGGIERNPTAARFLGTLGNVTFLERPFHPTTLISLAQSALRGRRRQYEARARLVALGEFAQSLERQVGERTAELTAGQARLRAIFETNYQYQGLLALDGTLLDANQTSLDGIEAKAGDVIGMKFWDTPWFAETPGMPEAVRAAVATVAAGETIRQELHVKLPGGWRSFDFGMRPVRDVDGAIIAIVPEAADITERRLAEEALRQSQKLEAMGQLTGGVAHDFNNLLTPIIGGLDLLNRNGLGNERERRLIDGALQSAERAKTLVQRLLAFARRQPLQPRPVDIAALVRDMGHLIASTTGPQIKVVVEAGGDLPAAKADANQLEMALLNLSVNARDAMPDGGTLRITVSCEKLGSLHPAQLAPGDYIRLSVADTGTGMDEETIARAIEPFFSTKGIGKGTGLGLSMVHGLASQLGGALTLASKPGIGTNIELWLPVSRDEMPADQSVTIAAEASGHEGTVLLVDDEKLVRASTAQMLCDLGYRVVEANSAAEALRYIETGEPIELLITDHLMPGMTGADLAFAVRDIHPALPMLIVSGYADTDSIHPDLPRLTKPFRQDELACKIAEVIAREAAPAQ
ncbi:MAG TPA: ATP-binding protein [Allosphingosinicella sp.]